MEANENKVTRKGSTPIKVYCLPDERAAIEANAQAAGMCSSRPGPRRPSLNSVRRGYGRRWKPRRPNARRARSAGDDACEFSDVRLASELAARSYIAAS